MRVTQNMATNQVLNTIQNMMDQQTQLMQQASTGIKVSVPSDDPVASQQILHLKSLNAANAQYSRNITNGQSELSMTDSTMSSMEDLLVRTKQVALSMANGTNNADSQSAALQELKQLKDQMISLGNTQYNGKFIFGGFKNDTPPFDAATGAFSGTADETSIQIDATSSVSITYSGQKLIAGGSPAGSSGTDIMGIFNNLITALGSGSTATAQAGAQAELTNLDSANSQVINARADIGARMNRLTSASNVNQSVTTSVTQVLSNTQDADYAKVISDLSKVQTAFQAAEAASAKVVQLSLLQYLQ